MEWPFTGSFAARYSPVYCLNIVSFSISNISWRWVAICQIYIGECKALRGKEPEFKQRSALMKGTITVHTALVLDLARSACEMTQYAEESLAQRRTALSYSVSPNPVQC